MDVIEWLGCKMPYLNLSKNNASVLSLDNEAR